MEGLLVLLAITLVILVSISIGKSRGLQEELRLTRLQMQELMKSLARPHGAVPSSHHTEESKPVPPPTFAPPPTPTPVVSVEGEPIALKEPPKSAPYLHPPVAEPVMQDARKPTAEPVRVVTAPPVAPPPPAPPRPSFLERNPDLEKFIGENLISKIGIAILVIGIGLALRYAIGRNMISETGRTLIGLGAGALLLFIAHRLRDKFRAFSSVLVGGGLVVLYFSIAIAFQQYHLLGQTPAFLVMVGITALGVLLTLAYDRKELAVIALLGGFASPFMASTGEGNFKVLFTYLLILDVGMLVLANYKKWHIINVIAFLLTAIIFGAWAVMRFSTLTPQPVWITFLFASAFFVVFFSMNLRYNLRHEHAFGPLDFSLLLANTAAYYGAGMYVLNALPMRITGAFTIVLALFHLVFAMLLFRKANVPRTLVYLLIGLVLTFISLAAPVQLHGNHITLFWAAECALLLWFSQRSGIRLVERASVLVLVLMLFSLMMDFAQHYGTNPLVRLTPLLNKPWITGMVSSVALGLYATLCDRLPQEREVLPGLLPRMLRNVAWTLFTVVLYLTNFLEVNHQLGYLCIQPVVAEALMAYSLFALLVADRLLKRAVKLTRSALLFGFAVLVFLYMVIFYANSRSALNELLTNNASGHLVFHYVTFALLIAALIRIAQLVRELITRPSQGWSIYLWTMCIALIIIGSQELDQVMLLIAHPTNSIVSAYDGSANAYAAMDTIQETLWRLRKAGYPILWGLGSFAFMWYGMRKRLRAIRIIALSLFALTLVKLFLFDIQGISEGGKVAAFISLGVLLLVVSFMYNKLKGLLKEDDQKMTP